MNDPPTETDHILAEAFSDIKLYVEHGKNEAFVEIKSPKLARFRLPEGDKDPAVCKYLLENNVVPPAAIDRWTQSELLHQVDDIKEEDMEYFGKTLTDEVTGEQYMLVPIDVDVLITPETLRSAAANQPYELLQKAEPFPKGSSIFVPQPGEPLKLDKNQVAKVPPVSQFHKQVFKVPTLCLGFELTLAPYVEEPKDSKVDLPLDGKLPSSNILEEPKDSKEGQQLDFKLPSSNLCLSPDSEMKL